MRLWDNLRFLYEQTRKNTNLLQAQGLGKQIAEIETERQKFEDTERRLYTKVEEFKSKKVVIKELFSAAEAQVRNRENLTGISGECWDGYEAQSLEKMIDFGVLTDYTSTTSGGDIEGTLQKMTVNSSVEELAKLRTSKQKTDGQEESVVAE